MNLQDPASSPAGSCREEGAGVKTVGANPRPPPHTLPHLGPDGAEGTMGGGLMCSLNKT